MRSGSRRSQSGLTYLAVLLFVASTGAMLAAAGTMWSFERQREKEAELIWIGNQYREAIALYYNRTPGTVKRYPATLGDLLEDRRHLTIQRYLRRPYPDPLTGSTAWGLVRSADGGIAGVFSVSEAVPVKTSPFPAGSGKVASRYSDWRFMYEPPANVVPERGEPLR